FDIGVGFPDLTRELSGMECLFARHVPVRFELDPGEGFACQFPALLEQLEEVRRHSTYARDLPARYSELRKGGEQDVSLGLPVCVALVEPIEGSGSTAGPALRLEVPQDVRNCRWVFNTSALSSADAERMRSQFSTFLAGVATDPDRPISTLPLMSEAERRTVLEEWNDTGENLATELCLHEL